MATIEQEEKQRSELNNLLKQLEAIKAEDLVRESDLGRDLNFSAGLPFFRRTLRLFRDLHESALETVPFTRLQVLTQKATEALTQFNSVKSFSLSQHPDKPAQTRDSFLNAIRDAYDECYNQLSPTIAYSIRKGTDFERLEDEARDAVEKIKKSAADQTDAINKKLNEANATLEKLRRAAQEAGVAQHNLHFKTEAEQNMLDSQNWLKATAGVAVGTLLLAIITFALYLIRWDDVAKLTSPQILQLTIGKLIIFSLLFTTVVWMGKTYRAHRHNYIVNRHRQNALSTFEAFVKAAGEDAQTKNAVLLQATQCIFSQQPSGYSPDGETSAGTPQILEIVRGISGKQA